MEKKILILIVFLIISCQELLISQTGFPIEEQLAQTNIRIIVKKDTNSYVGTGFFFQFVNEGIEKNILITNYHVISNVDTTILIFTKEVENRPKYDEHVRYVLTGMKDKWIRHPDTTIDLCYLDLAPIMKDANL